MKKPLIAVAVAVVVSGASLAAWTAFGPAKPRGNIAAILNTDFDTLNEKNFLSFVSNINLEGATAQQRLELFNRLKGRFDNMTLVQRLSIVLSMRQLYEKNPNDPLIANGRQIMQEYWAAELKTYHNADPEVRKKMIDARIDESLIYENVQNIQNAAKNLVGFKVEEPDVRQIQNEILRAIGDSMQNRPPEERALGAEYFLAMRARRIARGLKVMF